MQLSVLAILGIIFVTLKLCGVIAWSWLWVLAPFWVGIVVSLVVFSAGVALMLAKPPRGRR